MQNGCGMVKVTDVFAVRVSEGYWRLRERVELALHSVRVAVGGGKRTLNDIGHYCGIHPCQKDELMRPIRHCLDNCERVKMHSAKSSVAACFHAVYAI